MSTEPFDPYVIRTVRIDAIDATSDWPGAAPAKPDRAECRAALSFDGPIAAAEVLLAPPGPDGRHRVLAGAERVIGARSAGRAVLLAAVVGSNAAAPRVLGRWHVHHAA